MPYSLKVVCLCYLRLTLACLHFQDLQLSRVKASLDEALDSKRVTIEEKEKVDEELRTAQQRIHVSRW